MDKKGRIIIAGLGLWLIVAPLTFNYASSDMWKNNIICGILLVLFGLLSLKTEKKGLLKLAALTGLWLQLAPLVFWAKESTSYLDDTLVGMIVMVLVFSLKGFSDEEKGGEIPLKWSFNPSELGPRGVTVMLALVAWFSARYLASYQLGYVKELVPLFPGDGTVKVITSSVAKGFPVSDAGLGAFGYSLEFLLGIIGSSRRWKTMPWVSVFFGLLVIPAGMTTILLVILQPVVVGAWCGLCLIIAVCMLVMVLLTIPEMAATLQLLNRARKNNSFWKTFWHGDFSGQGEVAEPIQRNFTSEFGFTVPWNLLLTALLGAWLMCSPVLFKDLHPAADSNYVAGPLLFAVSILSFSEIIRGIRFFNLIVAAGLIFSAFILSGFSTFGFVNNMAVGVLVCALTLPSGRKRELYGKDDQTT
jgi:uncharacterized membrane protein